jgi:TRAP-type C4-dicarboxylate transport system permease small subunit
MLARDWTPVFNISRRYLYACIPVSGVIMVAYSVRNIVRETRTYWKTLRTG